MPAVILYQENGRTYADNVSGGYGSTFERNTVTEGTTVRDVLGIDFMD